MRLKFLKTSEQNSFKKRTAPTLKVFKLKYGNAAMFLLKTIRFEPVYFHLFRKWIKIYLNFKKYPFLKNRIWLNLHYNYPISKKSKNSRMGKGKGNFFRWTIRLPRNFVLLEFKTLNRFRARFLAKAIKYKIHSLSFFIKN